MLVDTKVPLQLWKTNSFSSTRLVGEHRLTKMRLIIIFVALCLIRKSIQKVEFYDAKTTPTDQISCVKTAFEHFFNDHSSLLIFSAKPNDIVNSLPRLPHYVATQSDSVRKISSVDRGAMIVFLEGKAEQDFTDLKRLLGIVTVQPVLVVCIANAICSSGMYIDEIVKMVNGAQLHYVAVDGGGIIDIYEYTTTAEGNCGVAQLVRLGHCSDKSTVMKVFQMPVNFNECPIRVVTWNSPQYSEPCGSDESNHLCGIERTVVETIAKNVNATPVSLTVQTNSDVAQLVAHRYADLGFGKIHMHPYADASYSMAYLFMKGTVAALDSKWTFKASIRDIISPFKIQVWLGIGILIVFLLVLRTLVPYFRKIYLLQLFGIILGIPVTRQPRRLPSRIYFFSLVYFGYHCSQMYLAYLTKVLSMPRQSMINTLDDLENSDLRVTGTFYDKKLFKDDYPRIYRDFQTQDILKYFTELNELFRERSDSVLYVEATDVSIAETKGIKFLEDRINWFPIAMVVPNSSVVLKPTNKVLASMMESGLLLEYISSFSMMMRNRSSRYSDSTSLEDSMVLEIGELQGPFYLLIAGLSLSFLVFLIEIMTPFIKRKVTKFLKWKGKIHPKWSRQRHVRGILLPRQASRASRR